MVIKHETARMGRVQTPIIPVIAELIRENPGTISLGQGVVNYGPPPQALERLAHFHADPQNHKYKSVWGIPELVAAIDAKLRQDNGLELGEENEVVVTAGANMGFMNAILAITDSGDEVIFQTPYYFNHEMAVTMADCTPVCVSTSADYQLNPDAILDAVTDRTRAVVTISPNNPTGAVYTTEALTEVNTICRNHGLYHISDEVYEYFTYDGIKHFSPGSIPGTATHTISLFSLSKAYGFASWRIGYMVLPKHLFTPVMKIQDTILICPPLISQWAALGALEAGAAYCREGLRVLTNVRKSVLAALLDIADIVEAPAASGAFYVLLRVHTDIDAMTLVERLIREYKVAVIPGATFGFDDGCYLRVAYGALDAETVIKGMGRLVDGLKQIVGQQP